MFDDITQEHTEEEMLRLRARMALALALEADSKGDDDTASEWLTIHSKNNSLLFIQS